MSDIKAELRLIREKCPIIWQIITEQCPFEFYDELEDCDKYLCSDCKECWDKAIESECGK